MSQPTTVWIVEDDPTYRNVLFRTFKTVDEIDCPLAFPSGEDAVAALGHELPPDVVLSDIEMPGMGGIECARQITARSPMTAVVMLTIHQDDEKIFQALCNGAVGYLLKPSSKEAIIRAVVAAKEGGAPINPTIARSVLDMFTSMSVPSGDYGLSDREREVLGLLVDGMTKNRIADELFLSYHTVDMHVRNIYAKLQVHTRSGAVAKALKEKLI